MLENGNLDDRSIARTHPAFQLYLEEREEDAAADLKDLKLIIDERKTSCAVEHLCVFQDERTEWIYVPENTGNLPYIEHVRRPTLERRALRSSSA